MLNTLLKVLKSPVGAAVAALLAISIGVMIFTAGTRSALKDAVKAAEGKGEAQAVSENNERIIENATKAHDAANSVRRNGAPLADCLQDNRASGTC